MNFYVEDGGVGETDVDEGPFIAVVHGVEHAAAERPSDNQAIVVREAAIGAGTQTAREQCPTRALID